MCTRIWTGTKTQLCKVLGQSKTGICKNIEAVTKTQICKSTETLTKMGVTTYNHAR